jgi:Zn-dependent peptidase ImmA (M78 family)/DNA-binding XRE family transcriptional regulator
MLNILEQRNPQEIGERLRTARSRSGLTQEDVSQKLSMARTTLVAIEKGQRRIRPNELRELAELYQVPINTLLRNSAIHVDLVPRFRALAQTDEASGMKAAQVLNSLATAEVELEQRLGQPLKMNYPPEFPIQGGDVRAQAEDVAMEMRHRFGIGLSPIMDVVSLLELEVGMRIFIRPLPNSSISGLFVYDEQLGGCMLLNQNHPRERRAISGCHEFGHFVSARKSPDMVDLAHAPQTREDRFANYFAMAFMMPAIVIRRKFQEMKQESGRFSPRHLILLAHYFNVSEEALCRRLEDLGLVPAGTWDSLKDRGFSAETVRQVLGDRAEKNEAVMPPRLWLLAAEAYRKEIFDEGQLAKMLCMDRIELRTMLDTMDVEGNDDLQSTPSH